MDIYSNVYILENRDVHTIGELLDTGSELTLNLSFIIGSHSSRTREHEEVTQADILNLRSSTTVIPEPVSQLTTMTRLRGVLYL